MQPPQSCGATNNDVQLHYRVLGEGSPAILLLSGGPGGSSNELLPVANELSRANRVILLDQRGTGRSKLDVVDKITINLAAYVQDVEAVRRAVGVDSWVILGHSAGGTAAMAAAAEHPEHVAGLILVESGGSDLTFLEHVPANLRHTEEDRATMKHWSEPERVAEDWERAARESYRAWVSGTVYDRSSVKQVMEYFVPERHTNAIGDLMMQDLVSIRFDLRPGLHSFEGPVLIIHGKQGFMGPIVAQQIHDTVPNSSLVIVDECGHYPMFEQADEFYAGVRHFLRQRF